MRKKFSVVAAFTAILTFLAGCQTAPKTDNARANLKDDAQAAMNRFERSDDTIRPVIERSAGYAVFPSVGKGGFVVGGSYGKGVVYQNGHAVGYADISEATFGFQIGGEDFAELVVIQDAETMNKFKQGGYGMAAEASAVALKPGAAAHAQFKKGVAVFVLIKSGAMAEAAVAGQKFRYSAGDSDRDEMNSHRRSEADTAGDRTRPITNISGSTSISTPNGGDAGVHGSTNVSGSTSVTTPNNGDRGVNSTDKRTTTTNGDGTKTTTTEEKTTTTK